mmetsp:Transcript_12359/g.24022  ORF Transcript_12359/g.24022 Transcript_12359/m.24022 type:complete len:564 (+) Transcript_12359:71-1762(+)
MLEESPPGVEPHDVDSPSKSERRHGSSLVGSARARGILRSPWRLRLGVRPLLRLRFLPWAFRELSFLQLLILSMSVGALCVMIASDSLPWLSESYCASHTRKPFCDRLAFRMAKAGRHLGGPLQFLTAVNFILVCRKPIYALTGISIERLAKWHRWTGQLVTVGSVLHGCCYYNGWVNLGVFGEKFFKRKNAAGTLALCALFTIWLLSLETVRRNTYQVFYRAHVVLVPIYVGALFFHYEAAQFAFVMCVPLVLFIGDKLVRGRAAYRLPWRISSVHRIGEDSLRLCLEPAPSDGTRVLSLPKFAPSAWVSVNIPLLSQYQTHPFSVCNSKMVQRKAGADVEKEPPAALMLYLRAPRGAGVWTREAVLRHKELMNAQAFIDGPYGGLELPLPLNAYDAIVFAAGGIGITPLLPIFDELLEGGSMVGVPIIFVFTTSDSSLIQEFKPALQDIAHLSPAAQVRIHFTDERGIYPPPPDQSKAQVEIAQGDAEAVVMQVENVEVSRERPMFEASAADVLAGLGTGSLIAALCCGPDSMEKTFMQAVSMTAHAQNVRVHYHREGFGL